MNRWFRIIGFLLFAVAEGLSKHESSLQWRYAECDIRETRDHQLIVFHDWDISAVPNSPENRTALGRAIDRQAICDLTSSQLKQLKLKCGCKIPTLERKQLFELARKYRNDTELEIHFLGFIRNIQRSFPDPKLWLKQCSEANFRVYQVYRPKTDDYDLCKTW